MIDRQSLVTRHNPHYTQPDALAPLSVGNGRFCFTADITGLQSLPQLHTRCPLCTMAEWGWHRYPDAPADDSALRLEMFDTYGRQVGYATSHTGQEELFYGLRQSAHKASLARIGLTLDGLALNPADLSRCDQTLNMWEGILHSAFALAGVPVQVTTFVHPGEDSLCVRVRSPLVLKGRLAVRVEFPYGSHKIGGADFAAPDRHTTQTESRQPDLLRLLRRMDGLAYKAELACRGGEVLLCGAHTASITGNGEELTLAARFITEGAQPKDAEDFGKSMETCTAFWESYWRRGGAVSLANSRDLRARELERRIVLSQYLMAIQSRGQLPPAETGLTINSWYGKFNVEMHCWHHAHFALWNRPDELRRSLGWYKTVLPAARDIARSQGYAGARWPKLCDAGGYNSPSSIAVLLLWQQPHPILLAHLCRAHDPSPAFLREYRDVIAESADFMASFAHWDGKRYVLGPPYIPSQERFDPRTVLNAGFEVEYFRWGLRAAARWLEALGETPDPRYTEVADKLALPVAYNGLYPAHENCPETYTQLPFYTDHPSMVAMLGVLAGEKVDRNIMAATLDKILSDWDLDSTWGWDFPMLAMTAARLGRPGQAVELLLMDLPKNRYLANGHNCQGDKEDLPLYLPGNGALLWAVGMMAAGWDGTEKAHAPGFPADGSFTVEWENLSSYNLL